ncbi:tripartite tricarboxylate transporter substrate binding protein [Sediminicoccus sp. KRV36]|uniref:Bug family tripartite tricarboxylate transporter substrate binding protein n=1 Tax=Sediminicoccus sp. KRV36 TaxID=3133721 RepID=UPI00200E8FDD|nr:tripartite tricarboxylate transporter substrate binding protein [Sediminicoccus rosea]UPY38029.1 tripartite tricarboxylate transporter substrate binding protein [Sediminicoccus rosea]
MRAFSLILLAVLLPLSAQSQSFPQRQVRIVVPFAAGGSADVMARLTAQALAARWNQPVVVENRLGAGGHVGAEHVARGTPDGHTLMLGSIGIHAASSVYRNLNYNPRTELVALTMLAEFPNVIIVHPAVPAQNLRELVALARQRPGELTFGSAGNATSTHLAGELFMLVTGVRLIHVPYRGSSQALNDVMAGNIQLMFENLPTVPPVLRDGRVRALALTSAARSPALPEVPTAAEAGVEGYVATAWFTIATAAATPAPLLQRLNEDLRAVLASPALRERFTTLGATPMGGTLAEAASFLAAETEKWTRVVDAAGIRLD